MIAKRASDERGLSEFSWLKSYHSFAFGEYFDPQHKGWGTLRVINEDFIKRGAGFETHPHRDMEIVTIVLKGILAHHDSMGNASTIKPLDVQRMTAGRGVTHSEVNDSNTEALHLFQIWIYPETKGLDPSYEQKNFADRLTSKGLHLVAAPIGHESPEPISLHQNAYIWLGHLDKGTTDFHPTNERQYLHLIEGELTLKDADGITVHLSSGDAAYIAAESRITLNASIPSFVLLFDVAPQ